MPKVSKIKLTLKSTWGEDYEIHYNAKNKPLFSVKGMPEDFETVTGGRTSGFETEQILHSSIQSLVHKYKELKQSTRKVIIYKASASPEISMAKSERGYCGNLPGISNKIDSFYHGAEGSSFGITYKVMMEVDHTSTKKYHTIKPDGELGFSSTLNNKEKVMDWTEERELFFKNIYESMKVMVLKISYFIDQDAENAALMIDSKQNLLG